MMSDWVQDYSRWSANIDRQAMKAVGFRRYDNRVVMTMWLPI
jgi:hypothetical protein